MKPGSLSDALKKVGRPLVYYPAIAVALGDLKTAVFICQFIYWEGKQADPEGWIYKTQAEITAETGLSRYEQETARKNLTELKILESVRKGQPARLYYRFDWGALDDLLDKKLGIPKAKKKPAPAATEDKPEPIIYRLKVLFDTAWEKQHPGQKFEWGKNKKLEGRNFGSLKALKDFIVNRLKEKNEEVTDEVIATRFELFLSMLNDFHRKSWLEPSLLVSNYNVIRTDLSRKAGGNGQSTTRKEFTT